MENLRRLNRIRNLFAHAKVKYTLDAKDSRTPLLAARVVDPRNIGEKLDFDGLYEEFCEKELTVRTYLISLLSRLYRIENPK
jgi:hypothetical protein